MQPPLGLCRGKVTVVPHDARWATLYEDAATELRACLGAALSKVEHIGSTAVADLEAKPILDLMVAVESLPLTGAFIAALRSIGYAHRPLDTVQGRVFYAKGPEASRTHYLSVCEAESGFWVSHLAFRDSLRADAALRRDYGQLKRRLAAQFPDDRLAYANAKEAFIGRALANSR